jgi:putative flippase GtrA
MSAIVATVAVSNVRWKIPAFAAVGVLVFCIDSGVTYTLVRAHAADPILARFPAFAVAAVVGFALSHWVINGGSRAPFLDAFLRYFLVCGVEFAVNWTAYTLSLWTTVDPLGLPVRTEELPLFIAFGTGLAMLTTFFGSKLFAFRARQGLREVLPHRRP